MLRRCHSAVIGACRPLAGSRLAALEAIAAQIPPGTVRERFADPTHSVPLAPDCIKAFAREAGANGFCAVAAAIGSVRSRAKGADEPALTQRELARSPSSCGVPSVSAARAS